MDILILEDHIGAQKWLSDAVHMAFGDETQITIADTIELVCSILNKQVFDLFLIDLHLPDGSGNEALIYAKKRHPDMLAVITTIYSDDDHLFPALSAGASGYLLKDDKKEDIAAMLAGILNGTPPLSPEIAQRLMAHFKQTPNPDIDEEEIPRLTKREQESLRYIVKGFSIKECAEIMEISPHTVSGYIKDIYKKLQVSSRAEVTSEAVRLGLV
ncbi:MAG: response regulator transcription factor [Gammaproteobacteria bacterium]|nr:response regulator transcription factor [Gammaproteobacteria bacterium]